jgi:hypothetical protein
MTAPSRQMIEADNRCAFCVSTGYRSQCMLRVRRGGLTQARCGWLKFRDAIVGRYGNAMCGQWACLRVHAWGFKHVLWSRGVCLALKPSRPGLPKLSAAED